MNFIKSLILGYEGSYTVFGTEVEFQKEPPPGVSFTKLDGAGNAVSDLADKCLNSSAFRVITQAYIHTSVHEMGHLIAIKALTGKDAKVVVLCANGKGVTVQSWSAVKVLVFGPDWKKTVIEAAGPLASVTFCSCKLVAATALRNYLSWPVSLVLGGGAVIYMSGELLYAYSSVMNKDVGDFGLIARRNTIHLALASTALVSTCALGVFAAINLAA